MIRIISHGYYGKQYTVTCHNCNCSFSYSKSDLKCYYKTYGIWCPECGKQCERHQDEINDTLH